MKRYFICKKSYSPELVGSFAPIDSILDWICFSIEQTDYNDLPEKAVEISKDVAIFGLRSFGDVRNTIKVSSQDFDADKEFDNLSYEDFQRDARIAIPMSEKRYNLVLKAMKVFAKVMIEDTFEERYKKLDDAVSELEKSAWKYICADIEDENDFILTDLAEAKNISVGKLRELVLEKQKNYDLQVKTLFVKMSSLKQRFYDCTTIRQLNRLYEDLFGIPMPEVQAQEEGKYDSNGLRQSTIPGIKF